jgi:sulfate permease, SulP family
VNVEDSGIVTNEAASLSNELKGGLSAALVTIPGNIIYGMIAFAPLGDQFVTIGIISAMTAAIVIGFIASLFRGVSGMIYGPKGATALVISSIFSQLLINPHIVNAAESISHFQVALIGFFTIFLSGLSMILFALMGLGKMIKFISHPVIAGILNGTAILVVISQIYPFFGLEATSGQQSIHNFFENIRPLSPVVAAVSFLLMWKGKRILPQIPAAVLSLFGGMLLYYGFIWLGFGDYLGLTLGKFSLDANPLRIWQALPETLWLFEKRSIWYIILAGALTIAFLETVDDLLSALSWQNLTLVRPDTNREILSLGVGNALSGLLGGISGSGFLSRSNVSYDAGGRSWRATMACAIFVLLIGALFAPLIPYIPKAVIAGMVIVIGLGISDRWSLHLFKAALLNPTRRKKRFIANLALIAAVMIITLIFKLIIAVIIGIALSVMIFVIEMSRSAVRRVVSGESLHSKTNRSLALNEILNHHRHKIAIIDLEGTIFFASADNISDTIEQLITDGKKIIIINMKRVSRIDSTGGRVLQQLYRHAKHEDVLIIFSYLTPEDDKYRFLSDLDLIQTMDPEKTMFPDTDRALEYAENTILNSLQKIPAFNREDSTTPAILRDLDDKQLDILLNYLEYRAFEKGEIVFSQGDPGDCIHLIVTGRADVILNVADMPSGKRLQRLEPGTIFGEMALLDGQPRSANVIATDKLRCQTLTIEKFRKLIREQPEISMQIMTNIARIVADRMRGAHKTIFELEQ